MSKKASRRVRHELHLIDENMKTEQDGIPKKSFHLKDLKNVHPITENQKKAFFSYNKGNNLMLHGSAGTGKTFLGMFLALRDVLDSSTPYEKVIVIRSSVATRDIGFLPGTEEEKMEVYEHPYISICDELFTFKKTYETMKKLGYIHFASSSYLRGVTFDHAIIVVDEVQNLSDEEINTVMTRIGHKSKIVLCGDTLQNDLRNKSGLGRNLPTFKRMGSFDMIQFDTDDIVRSNLVKEWIINREITENNS